MTNEPLQIESIVAAISDGVEVDWASVESTATTEQERCLIKQLRVIAEVYLSHRRLPDIGPSEASMPGDDSRRPGSAPEASRSSQAPIWRWGHLDVMEKIGEGGFSEVYRAWDSRLHREVALKLLTRPDPGERERSSALVEEGRLLASVRNRSVATVYGAERHGDRTGLWMEFIQGMTLSEIVRLQGPFGAREATLIGLDLCRAVAAIHAAGLVHRDIKPQNVIREAGGRIVLLDFGSGWELEDGDEATHAPVSGTPLYMPPEALLGRETSRQSDIYSLGVLLYYLVTGSHPVIADSLSGLREAHRRREARLLRDVRPDLPEPFVQVVERALAWEPGDRFDSPGQMEQALSRSLGFAEEPGRPSSSTEPGPRGSAPSRGRARWLLPIAALSLAGIAMTLVAFWPGRPEQAPSGSGLMGFEDVGAEQAGAVSESPADLPQGSAESSTKPPTRLSGPAQDAPAYSVSAAMYRTDDIASERLLPGARIAPGDELFLEFEATTELYVYVINGDDLGETYVLFPMSRSALRNPLSPGKHKLPGRPLGENATGTIRKRLYWQVTSAGGREHFLIVASPERLPEIEADIMPPQLPRRRNRSRTPSSLPSRRSGSAASGASWNVPSRFRMRVSVASSSA